MCLCDLKYISYLVITNYHHWYLLLTQIPWTVLIVLLMTIWHISCDKWNCLDLGYLSLSTQVYNCAYYLYFYRTSSCCWIYLVQLILILDSITGTGLEKMYMKSSWKLVLTPCTCTCMYTYMYMHVIAVIQSHDWCVFVIHVIVHRTIMNSINSFMNSINIMNVIIIVAFLYIAMVTTGLLCVCVHVHVCYCHDNHTPPRTTCVIYLRYRGDPFFMFLLLPYLVNDLYLTLYSCCFNIGVSCTLLVVGFCL